MQVHTYVAILRMPTELRLTRAYLGYGYRHPRQQLRAYYCYGYGCTTTMATDVLRLRLRAYYDYGYGRTMTEATGERTGVLRLLFYCVYRVYVSNPELLRDYLGANAKLHSAPHSHCLVTAVHRVNNSCLHPRRTSCLQ